MGPAPLSPSAVGLQPPPSPNLPLVVGPAPISMSPSAVGMQSLQAPWLSTRAASSYQSFWSGCWLSTRPSGKQAATSLSGQAVGFPPSPQGSKQPPVFLARLWLSTSHSGQQAATSLQSGQAVGFPPAPQGSKQLPVFLARLLAFHQPLRLRDTSQCSGSLGTSQ